MCRNSSRGISAFQVVSDLWCFSNDYLNKKRLSEMTSEMASETPLDSTLTDPNNSCKFGAENDGEKIKTFFITIFTEKKTVKSLNNLE
jgi:hypothetical protein